MATNTSILLGRRIRSLRLAKGWKQIDLAVAMKLDKRQTYISIIELGKTDMSVITAQKVADALEVDIGQLFINLASEETKSKTKDPRKPRR